jgi:mannose-6-phosphate isomerase-like protein (cupin superfamily)
MTKFVCPNRDHASQVLNDHGGQGPILFQRVLQGSEFRSEIEFVDCTVIPPSSTIGRHEHHGNEEIYFVVSGTPLMRVSGEEARLQKGALSIVRDGEWHELINDTDQDVEILVIQVGMG